jgi:hypothetical protein
MVIFNSYVKLPEGTINDGQYHGNHYQLIIIAMANGKP